MATFLARLAAGVSAAALLAAAAHGYTVRRVAQSLKDADSRFVRVEDAPQTRWERAGSGTQLSAGGPQTQFGPAGGPSTVFRTAEVPPERLERTQALLGELQARQDERQSIVIDLPADVLFDFDKADLRPDAQPSLARAAELLHSYPTAPVRVRGHTDAKGSDAYNEALSIRRAEAVAAALARSAGRERISAQGLGEREPVAPNVRPDGSDDPEGRQRNRRVEIVIEALPSTPGKTS